MPATPAPAITLAALSFAWPDGTAVFDDLSATLGHGRTGLIGDNGTGKSTLLKLITGELAATSGSVTTTGTVAQLPQHIALRTGVTVAELLGVHEQMRALRAIESGDVDPTHFDVLGEQWDVETRSLAALASSGLDGIGLDRPVGSLSGGEAVRIALAGAYLASAEIVLWDEPTNDLDRGARHRLYDAISTWSGTLVVVSHDVELLNLMDATAELHGGGLSVFGGSYDGFLAQRDAQQAAAAQDLRTAEQHLRLQERERVEARTKLARRRRYARTDFENRRRPKMIMKTRAQEAQVSEGKLRGAHDAAVDSARQDVSDRERDLRDDLRIRLALPDPEVPAGRRLAELRDANGRGIVLQGPQRVALTGRNGIGKTSLLRNLLGAPSQSAVQARAHTRRIGLLPQRLDHLGDDLSVLESVRRAAPVAEVEDLRAMLARLLFRGEAVDRLVGDLSGGERFRVALAQLALAAPPHQLLVLDEPTNSLDLHSIDALVEVLDGYRGGLLVVSHDEAFLARLGIDSRIILDEDGLHPGANPSDAAAPRPR